ncbi:hypothetical protein DFH06DRAFT_1343599 [Mycena polygramma]|nr:hypothetical protein DFH06DRAFT_1343599 [Mycena polygramma]
MSMVNMSYPTGSIDSCCLVPYVNRLPFEVLGDIFMLALGCFWVPRNKAGLIRSRFAFAWVCRWWRSVALGSLFLWDSLDFYSGTRADWIQYSVLRVPAGPVELRLDLRRGGLNSVVSIFNNVSILFPRCRLLWLLIRDAQSLHTVASLIRNSTFGSLRTLNLHCIARQADQMIVPMFDFTGGFDTLQSLRLRRIWFNFAAVSSFASLKTFAIREIVAQFAPDWVFWVTLETAAPLLEQISIRRVGCAGIPILPRTLSFPRLTHLDLNFAEDDETLYNLVSTFHAPALTFILVFAKSTKSLGCLLSFPGMLLRIHELVLRIPIVKIKSMHAFLTHTPSLYFLDVLTSEHLVLEAMCITSSEVEGYSSPDVFVCPRLGVLGVGDELPSTVREFLETRSVTLKHMVRILFREGLPYEDDEEEEHIDWIDERLAIGANLPFVNPYWIKSDVKWVDS